MSKQIQAAHTATGAVLYAVVRDSNGNAVIVSTGGVETYQTANLANYKVTMTEQGASRFYTGNMPPVSASDLYAVTVYVRVGASPAEGDTLVTSYKLDWDADSGQVQCGANVSAKTLNGVQFDIGGWLNNNVTVDGGIGLKDAINLIMTVLVGPLSGADTNQIQIKSIDSSKVRVTANVDSSGNRLAVTTNLT